MVLGVHGNFLCNWHLTQQCHQEGELLVLFDETEGIPIAYQCGQLLQPGILQVRNTWRGKGLGRLVVQHCISLALEHDEMVLQIECEPESSIPFWKAMGFSIIKGEFGDNPKGYRVLSKQLEMPVNGIPMAVSVKVYPEKRMWEENVSPTASYSPKAVRGNDGKVYLAERAVVPNNFSRTRPDDSIIELVINGELIYRNKARYKEAQNHGVRRCRNGFFVDIVAM